METYQITPTELGPIKNLFWGYIFRRKEGEKAFIKCSSKQLQKINKHLNIHPKQVS